MRMWSQNSIMGRKTKCDYEETKGYFIQLNLFKSWAWPKLIEDITLATGDGYLIRLPIHIRFLKVQLGKGTRGSG
jgi:hypothetical protein